MRRSLLADIDAYYGDSHVLQRVSFALGEGRLLGLLGRNGAGKSTCMNVAVGLLPPRARQRRGASARRRDRLRARGDRRPGRRAGAAGPAHLPQPDGAREPRGGGAQRRGDRRAAPWTLERVFDDVSAAARAARADAGHPVRRRAADAGDRPRADGQSARAADGRAVRGPGAADRRRGDGDDPAG